MPFNYGNRGIRGIRQGVPSGRILARSSAGTGAIERLTLPQLIQKLCISGQVGERPTASGNSNTGTVSLVSAPTHSTSSGSAGMVAYDGNYWYVCTATNSWGRVAIGGPLVTPNPGPDFFG